MIYRTFRLEGRVIQKERFFRRSWAKRKHTESSSHSSSKPNEVNEELVEPRSDAAAHASAAHALVNEIPTINQLILSDSLQIGPSPGDSGEAKH